MGCSLFANYHFQMGVTVMGFAEDFGLCQKRVLANEDEEIGAQRLTVEIKVHIHDIEWSRVKSIYVQV